MIEHRLIGDRMSPAQTSAQLRIEAASAVIRTVFDTIGQPEAEPVRILATVGAQACDGAAMLQSSARPNVVAYECGDVISFVTETGQVRVFGEVDNGQ